MDWVLFTPKDQRKNTWILFELREVGLRLREQYEPLRCSSRICGKVNELRALEQGADSNVKVPAKADYMITDDGFILFSRRLVDLFNQNNVTGYRTFRLPGDERFVIAWPTRLVPTDRAKMGIQIHGGICETCGRARETCFLPTLSSLALPTEPLVLFSSDVPAEKSRSQTTWFTTTADVMNLMKKNKVTGVEYNKPY